MIRSLLKSAALLLSVSTTTTVAYHRCNNATDDLCPQGNTCCPSADGSVYTCISTKYPDDGTCCSDTVFSSGCGDGFYCAISDDNNSGVPVCLKRDDFDNNEIPDTLPRYKTCTLPTETLTQAYGLPVLTSANETIEYPQLVYLSTLGPLDDTSDAVLLEKQAQVETIFIMVHGSGRNVEDYICSANSAVPNTMMASNTTMVLAPWFMSSDEHPEFTFYNRPSTTRPLRWSELGPIFHTWRYGADAVNAILQDNTISVSSYDVMDVMMEALMTRRFPKLKRIVLAGHSAGGQYTQRWALLSNSPVFQETSSRIHLRTVVANPRSLCFLDDRRMINGTFQVPDSAEECYWYNQWEWGLGPGDVLDVPYKVQAIQEAGGVDSVVQRYPQRDIVYIAGEMDVYSHGDGCQDLLQGAYRRARSEHFFESLRIIFGRPVHHRLVVEGVPHDHTLMFQSPEGQEALWGLHSPEMTLDQEVSIE